MIYLRNVESCCIDVTNQAMPVATIPSVIITFLLSSVISDAITSDGGSHRQYISQYIPFMSCPGYEDAYCEWLDAQHHPLQGYSSRADSTDQKLDEVRVSGRDCTF